MLSRLMQGAARLGLGKKAARPARAEVLKLRPQRNPALEWYEENDRVVLHVHRVHNWKTRLANVFMPLPNDRRIELDAIGTDVWRMLDGKATIAAISKAVAGKYQLTPREAEISVQQFFQELGRRGFVGFESAPGAKKKAARR